MVGVPNAVKTLVKEVIVAAVYISASQNGEGSAIGYYIAVNPVTGTGLTVWAIPAMTTASPGSRSNRT